MSISKFAARVVNYGLRRQGLQLVSMRPRSNGSLPSGAKDYLVANNPRLQQLGQDYARFDRRVTESIQWKSHTVRGHDLLYFRGDNAYVWQLQGGDREVNYAISARYIESIDSRGILGALTEDGSFGAHAFNLNGRQVSRDLLDSIAEIYFLDRHLGIFDRSDLSVIDIGAGYGRMAHRMVMALPQLARYLCTDAIPVSTFLSEYHLKYRGLEGKVKAVPVTEIEAELQAYPVDLAINIHSFSECKVEAVTWWLRLLRDRGIKYLMVVPNAMDHGGTKLLTSTRTDLAPLFADHGFELVAHEPKYLDPFVQRYGVQSTYHYLFQAK